MTSYAELARILAASLPGTATIAAARITRRNEVLVELRTGENFLLSPMFVPAAEVQRLGAGETAQ